MKNLIIKLLIVFSLLVTCQVKATVVEDLYSIEHSVADQTTSQRLSIFNSAFKDVIVKVSGSAETLSNPGLTQPLKKSARYVREFRYFTRKDPEAEAFDNGQLFLNVTFNQEAIERLLRENGIAIWGRERPNTLLLINYDINKKVSVVSSDTTMDIVEIIDEIAKLQGLPVLFPLLDLEDRMIFGTQDITDANEESFEALASRYIPDAILSGQIIGRSGQGWQGIWQIRFAKLLFSWEYKSRSRQQVIQQALSRLAQTLANEYALNSYQSGDQDVLLSIDNMLQVIDHINVLKYLKSLDAIKSVRPIVFESNKVTYQLVLRNSKDDLSRLISLGNTLEQLSLPQIDTSDTDKPIAMNYRLIQ